MGVWGLHVELFRFDSRNVISKLISSWRFGATLHQTHYPSPGSTQFIGAFAWRTIACYRTEFNLLCWLPHLRERRGWQNTEKKEHISAGAVMNGPGGSAVLLRPNLFIGGHAQHIRGFQLAMRKMHSIAGHAHPPVCEFSEAEAYMGFDNAPQASSPTPCCYTSPTISL